MRKELLMRRKKLFNEINHLKSMKTEKDINVLIKEKIKEYKFINNLLKVI